MATKNTARKTGARKNRKSAAAPVAPTVAPAPVAPPAPPVIDRTPIQGIPENVPQHSFATKGDALPTRKTDTLVQDFAPVGLLNTRAFVRAQLAAAAPKQQILYIHVRTPRGGSEFRPMGLFTKLPAQGSAYIIRGETGANPETTKRPQYTYVGEFRFD